MGLGIKHCGEELLLLGKARVGYLKMLWVLPCPVVCVDEQRDARNKTGLKPGAEHLKHR